MILTKISVFIFSGTSLFALGPISLTNSSTPQSLLPISLIISNFNLESHPISTSLERNNSFSLLLSFKSYFCFSPDFKSFSSIMARKWVVSAALIGNFWQRNTLILGLFYPAPSDIHYPVFFRLSLISAMLSFFRYAVHSLAIFPATYSKNTLAFKIVKTSKFIPLPIHPILAPSTFPCSQSNYATLLQP